MPKQRRARPRPSIRKSARTAQEVGSKPTPNSGIHQKGARFARPTDIVQAAAPPVRRSGYLEAVARYELGLQSLQRREYAKAAEILRSVLSDHPEEKELHERVRLYLNVCERQDAPPRSAPRTTEERLYAATLALNAGAHAEAVDHLGKVRELEPENDHAIYMLAVVHTLRGDLAAAAPLLTQAVELNPDNRSLARQDPDLEPLRRDEAIRTMLDTSVPRAERRRPVRGRQTR